MGGAERLGLVHKELDRLSEQRLVTGLSEVQQDLYDELCRVEERVLRQRVHSG